jgi:hypothetical protein
VKSVLIVSPHFPPINAADHQRVRMALPYFEQFGWRPTVLAVRAECVQGVADPFLAQTLPAATRVVWTEALSAGWAQKLGIGSLAYRAWWHVRRAGEGLLSREPFDAVFFSTTQFPLMALGWRWKRQFSVPYVLDIQDPWYSDYYDQHPEQRPPGGRLKYGFSRWLARRQEPPAIREAGNVVCVSPAYPQMFMRRYPGLPPEHFTTLPFGAPQQDFSVLDRCGVTQPVFDPGDGRAHWVYVGRGGDDMAFAVRAFFTALRRQCDAHPEWRDRLRLHFIGTDYAPKGRARQTIKPLAEACGVGDMVEEQTDRLPYFQALRCLRDAQALFVPGSDDTTYTASKLYPYILAKKPLLAVFHEKSSVVEVVRRTSAGIVVTFDEKRDLEKAAAEIQEKWFARWPMGEPSTDWLAFAPYTAESMTRKLCEVFDRVADRTT